MSARRVLLTGAASLVGAEVLRALLARPEVGEVRLLLPPGPRGEARRERLEAFLGPLPERVTTLPGEPWEARFGLAQGAWEQLARELDLVLHAARRDTPDQDLERARVANLRPVENWVSLLGHHPELTLHLLSTGLVGGTRQGLLTEFDLEMGQGFHDAAERSSFEAEQRLRESGVSDRVVIYRPGLVLGRASDGAAFHLGGAYALLASLAQGHLLPGDGRARLDWVSADFVAQAMVSLALGGGRGTYHLARGWHGSLTVQATTRVAAAGRGRRRGARLIPRGLAFPLAATGVATRGGLASRHRAYTTARHLLHQGPVLDTYRAQRALAAAGLAAPDPATWLGTAVRAAAEQGWAAPPEAERENPAPGEPLSRPAAAALRARHDPRFQEKRFHQIGDVQVAYRDLGEGEPVVFTHGFAGAHAWDGVVERMVDRYRCIVVETLGISDSTAPSSADFGLPAQAARVRGLLSALEIPTAHVVSNDTGGVIAQFFAVRWPQCVRSLTLSDCDAHGIWPPTQVARMARFMRLPGGTWLLTSLMKASPPLARSSLGLGRMVHDRRLLTDERLSTYLHTISGDGARRMRFRRFFNSFDPADIANVNHLLSQLQVPTMVIWGGDNAYWSASYGKVLYDSIPGARRFEIIPFASISCHEERPDLFARLVLDFLREVGAHESTPDRPAAGDGDEP